MTTKDARSVPARPPRVLVVEGNAFYRSVISHVVELAGGQWESVSEIDPGRKLLAGSRKFDLVIIGLDPESDINPEILTEIRSVAPIILLDESYNGALQKFEAGVEQILPKPFVPDALVGAIKVEFRAAGPSSVVPIATKIEVGGLVFDVKRRAILREGTEVRFTKREWEVVAFLLASPQSYFSAEEILAQTWGTEASSEQLRSYVARMREKLEPFKAWCQLVSEKGRGYSLVIQGASDKNA
jgi:two-component system, OmpR family, KDP operon response regulator KdpE